MRAAALLGGMAVVGAVALSHRPSSVDRVVTSDRMAACAAGGSGDFCAAVAKLAGSLKAGLPLPRPDILPPASVPGGIDAAVRQNNIDRTICVPGYARSARPPLTVIGPLKRRMMEGQHPGEPMAHYELDHLIPIAIGGAPLDARNLWLQPRRGQANAADKNLLAYVLWRLVCEHRVPLAAAQRAISTDWTRAYDSYATPENVAEYHFRHDGEDD